MHPFKMILQVFLGTRFGSLESEKVHGLTMALETPIILWNLDGKFSGPNRSIPGTENFH